MGMHGGSTLHYTVTHSSKGMEILSLEPTKRLVLPSGSLKMEVYAASWKRSVAFLGFFLYLGREVGRLGESKRKQNAGEEEISNRVRSIV